MTEWQRDGFVVTDDPARIDLDVVHAYLSNESYWALHRTREQTQTALAASWCFTVIDTATGSQVGFARLVTDYVTYAWLADVFVVTASTPRSVSCRGHTPPARWSASSPPSPPTSPPRRHPP